MPKERKIKLLVIDDEEDICSFMKSYFQKQDIDVYTATAVKEGISLAKKELPDIAVLDIHLGKDPSGIEVLKNVLEVTPKTRCVMITWDKEKALEAKKLGAVDFLIKPVEVKDLTAVVDKALKTKGRE